MRAIWIAVIGMLAGTTLSVAMAHEEAEKPAPKPERYWLMIWSEHWSHALGFYQSFEACEYAFNDAYTGIKENKPKHVCLHLPRPDAN